MQLAIVLGIAIGTRVGGALFGFATAVGHSTATAIAVVEAFAVAAAVLGLAAAARLASVSGS